MQVARKQIAVVLLNWNAAEDTLRCVQRLAAWQRVQPVIWVVDNASAEHDRARLAAGAGAARLIWNEENQGFSGGVNRGIEAALAAGAERVFLLNNDAEIDEPGMARLLATLDEDASVGVVGPLLYDGNRRERLLSAGARNLMLHHHNLMAEPPAGTPVYAVEYVSGSATLVRASVLREVGLLDEAYFFNVEVADFCRRARERGYRTVVDRRARAYHNLERSSPLRGTLYTYYLARNRFRYIAKFYRGLRLPLSAAWAAYTLLLAGKLAILGHRDEAAALRLALADALAGRWGGQNERVLAACGVRVPQPSSAQTTPHDRDDRAVKSTVNTT